MAHGQSIDAAARDLLLLTEGLSTSTTEAGVNDHDGARATHEEAEGRRETSGALDAAIVPVPNSDEWCP